MPIAQRMPLMSSAVVCFASGFRINIRFHSLGSTASCRTAYLLIEVPFWRISLANYNLIFTLSCTKGDDVFHTHTHTQSNFRGEIFPSHIIRYICAALLNACVCNVKLVQFKRYFLPTAIRACIGQNDSINSPIRSVSRLQGGIREDCAAML